MTPGRLISIYISLNIPLIILSFGVGTALRLGSPTSGRNGASPPSAGPGPREKGVQTGTIKAENGCFQWFLLLKLPQIGSEMVFSSTEKPREEVAMHLAAYANSNFTCRAHLERLEKAARWARDCCGAKYLMIWEEELENRRFSLARGANAPRKAFHIHFDASKTLQNP